MGNFRGMFVAVLLMGGVVGTVSARADVMRVTYDLAQTTLEIRNLPVGGDQSHAIGPGTLVIDYTASGGVIVDGPVHLHAYELTQEFSTTTAGATVSTDIFAEANFTGALTYATGILSGGVITWNQTFPYKVSGTNLCTGTTLVCTLAGFTVNVPRDEGRQDPVTFAPFRFGNGGPAAGAGFNGDELLLPGNDQADTYLLLRATETSRKLLGYELSDVLRVVQFFNAGRYHCRNSTEDGFDIGPPTAGGTENCEGHQADYQGGANFRLNLSELLRTIQLFSLGGAIPCPIGQSSEDGFCSN